MGALASNGQAQSSSKVVHKRNAEEKVGIFAQAYLQAYQRPAGARDRSQGIKNIFDSIGNQISENDRKRLIASYGNSETPKSLEQVAAEQNYVSTGDLGAMQNYQTRMDNAAYTQSQKEATEAESKIKEQEIASDNLRTVNSELINLNSEYNLAKNTFDTIAADSPGKKEARIEMETKKAALGDKMAFKKYLEGKLGYTGQETLELSEPSNIETTIKYPKPDKTIEDVTNIFPMSVDVNKPYIASDNVNAFDSPFSSDKSTSELLTNNLINVKPIEGTSSESTEGTSSKSSEVLDKDSIAAASFEKLANYNGTLTNDDKLNIVARLNSSSFKYLSEPSKTKDEADQRIADKNNLISLGIAKEDLGFINTKVAATKEELNAKANAANQNKFKKDLENAYANDITISDYMKHPDLYSSAADLLFAVPSDGIDDTTKKKLINDFINSKKGK